MNCNKRTLHFTVGKFKSDLVCVLRSRPALAGARITPVRKPSFVFYDEMPARLEMLLDTPPVPYEVASQHAWNKEDRSLNIFIKENDEDASSENGDAFRPGRVGSTASLTHKIEALKMNSAASASASAAASMGNGDAASHFQLVNGNVNGHVNGEINGDHAR